MTAVCMNVTPDEPKPYTMKRLYFAVLCCLAVAASQAQTKNKNKKPASFNAKEKKENTFLQKQWWVGLKAGTNLSKAVVTKTYSVLSPTNYNSAETRKVYEDFNKAGSQATLEITFYFKGFCLSLQPTYRRARFVYTNQYLWTDSEDVNNTLLLNYAQEQKVDHAVFPLLARYEIGSNTLRPYVQAGIYSAFLINANKSVNINGVDYASGGINPFESEPIEVGATDLFAKKHWGMAGGIGLNYSLGNIRVNFDVLYQYGMSNISSTKNRFSNDRLAGVGDALDDMKMNNLTISLGCLFPLRFLESGFKSMHRK